MEEFQLHWKEVWKGTNTVTVHLRTTITQDCVNGFTVLSISHEAAGKRSNDEVSDDFVARSVRGSMKSL